MELVIGGKYNWIGQAERLEYLGKEGMWNLFSKVGSTDIWCDVLDRDLHLLEETKDEEPEGFKVSSEYVTYDSAVENASALEKAIGEVLNGDRQAANLPVEPMVKLIQYVRQRQ